MSYPSGPQQPPYGPSQPPKAGMSTGKKFGIGCGGRAVAFILFFMMAGCMAAIGGSTASSPEVSSSPSGEEAAVEETDDEPTEEEEEEAEEEPVEEEPAEEEPASTTIGSGVHQVGTDIEPGTYSTDGPDQSDIVPTCYYARLSGLSGEFDDIIANNILEGPGTVQVSEGDVALELTGSCEWTLQE